MSGAITQVLLVYPDNDKRSQIKRCLEEQTGCRIIEAADGNDAIKYLQKYLFQAIVSDIDLIQLDIWRLTRLIRSDILKVPDTLPVIIVSTTFSERIAEATAKEIEANAFLPFSQYEQLPDLVNRALIDQEARLNKSKILVIEDFSDTIRIVERVLSNRFHIESATDGESGLALWRKNHYDIVLLDLMLPKMSGKDVLRTIMKEKPSQSVIMMTAFGDPERASSLLLDGAIDFISKPFRAEQLRKVTSIAVHCDDYIVSNQQYIESRLALADEQQRAEITLASIGDGVITTDATGAITYLNPVAESLTGWRAEEAKNTPLRTIFNTYHEYSKSPALNALDRCLKEQKPIESSGNILLRNRYSNELIIEHSAAPIRDKDGNLIGAVMVFKDNTESEQMAQKLSFHSSHDNLTGLHNREILDQSITNVLSEIKQTEAHHTLCHVDLNNFKLINDSCGHAAGDKLLQEIAQLLVQKIRVSSDTIARIGADEFGILFRHCPVESAQRVAQSIVETIQDYSFEYGDNSYRVGISLGLAPINCDTPNLRDINNSAETASKMAKENGGNRYHVFNLDDNEQLQRHGEIQVITSLLRAERDNLFELYCQPITANELSLHEPDSYELLLRLKDDEGNVISPGQFLSAAERYNLMTNIDRWVIRTAIEFFKQNPHVFNSTEHFTINLSGQSLNDESCYVYIQELLSKANIENQKICFEITETAAIRNLVRAGNFIGAIRQLGCKFALDDFGSGMSSFAYLKRLPVDFLKIDGMFVKGLIEDPIDLAMVKSINDIGHVLKLKTIAEFVENEDILEKLKELGVDYSQGYHIAKPEPLNNLKDKYKSSIKNIASR